MMQGVSVRIPMIHDVDLGNTMSCECHCHCHCHCSIQCHGIVVYRSKTVFPLFVAMTMGTNDAIHIGFGSPGPKYTPRFGK